MTWLARLMRGLTALVRPRQAEQELDDELAAYLEMSAEAKMRRGVAREAAVRAARAEIGSLAAVKDYTRDAGWETRLEHVWHDVRYAARRLRRSPGFTIVAVLTLALGIGANTAIFSAINAVMLRRLPVERPHELIALVAMYPTGIEPFSYAAYRTIATDASHVVDAMAASTGRRDAVSIDGPPESVDYKWVSGNYFTALGVPAAVGRTLLPADDGRPPGEAVAVISDAFWTRRFGRDPAALGRAFRLRGTTFTIVGVAPRGFFGESPGEILDVWMPLSAQPAAPSWLWNGHSTTWLRILARRKPGVTLESARTALVPVYDRIRQEVAGGTESREFRASVLESRLVVLEGSRGSSRLRDNLSLPLLILMAIVGLVLIVACSNVANLLLARAAANRRETAVCLAIGAGRLRVARQGVAEAVLLASLGGVAGLVLATWAGSAFVALVSGALPISLDVSPDMRVLGFTMLVSCATAVVCGLAPALRAARVDPLPALNTPGGQPLTRERVRFGRLLVVAQIAVSLVLLVAAGLFVRSLMKLQEIETGFDPDRVLLFAMPSPAGEQPVPPAARRNLYRELLERAERIPGIEAASASFSGMFTRGLWGNVIAVEGFVPPPGIVPRTYANSISPRYFDVLRIAVLQGRAFTDADHDSAPKVAIVNRTFANRYFGTARALGRRVAFCSSESCGTSRGWMEIVGVVEDAKYADLREEGRPMLYVPFTQFDQVLGEVEVRTAGEPSAVAAAIHRELAAVDSRLAIVGMIEARDHVNGSIVAERLIAKLSATFGLLALALAAVGLYGLISYVTSQRTGEIGIRIALGAEPREVRGLVLRDTFKVVGIGLLLGIPGAMIAARLLASQLYEVAPADPIVLAAGVVSLSCVAALAGFLPARRAARIAPSVTLRSE